MYRRTDGQTDELIQVELGNLFSSSRLTTLITLPLLVPTVRAIDVHGSATIDGGGRRDPPFPKRDGGGHPTRGRPVLSRHCRPPCPSLPPAPCPCPGPDHRRCRPPLPPACAKPHPPRLVPHLCPRQPCQELCKPPRRPPLPLLPMATTTPTTSTASKP